MQDVATPQPFYRTGPERPALPVVLSVPHAGRAYSPALLKMSRLPLQMLETLEDRLVDRLVWRATAAGATAIVARAPRAEIDLNRDERELDPSLITPPPPAGRLIQSARTRGGLGLIPARIAGAGSIWLHRINPQELDRRVREVHRPYHEALQAELAATRDAFGIAILLDCHSMPPRTVPGEPAMIVLGDRHGTSAAPELMEAASRTATARGYRTACNNPYAGGYVVSRHGRPAAGIHAIQLEIDRSAYLDSKLREPGAGFEKAAQLIEALVHALSAQALGPCQAIAAE